VRFVRYDFPGHMGGVVGALMGAIWGAFLRRFTGHIILETVLFVFGVLTISIALYYRPSFQTRTDGRVPQK